MPHYLVTGVPGTSKTLNTIKMVRESKEFKGRKVYYSNIKEVIYDDWEFLEDPTKWEECDSGSVIIIDECQQFYPTRSASKEVPPHIEAFTRARHSGYHLIFVTQHPKLIDVLIRRLVDRHRHYKRPFGWMFVSQMEWQSCADDPDNFHKKKEATKKIALIDKKYFGAYKSADEHNIKAKFSWKMVSVLLAFSGTAYALSLALSGDMLNVTGSAYESTQSLKVDGVESNPNAVRKTTSTKVNTSPQEQKYIPMDEWIDRQRPRVIGLDFTAPMYDQVREVRDYPKPHCIRNDTTKSCRCYTQQMTAMAIDNNTCSSIVDNGLWDPAQEPKNDRNDNLNNLRDGKYIANERVKRALAIYRAESLLND